MRILLYSGGLDSLIAWYYLDKPQRMYVDLGTKYSSLEWLSITQYAPGLDESILYRIHMAWGVYEKEDAWLPMRNLLLTMLAAAEGADKIYLVAQKGEQSIPDRSPDFFKQTSELLSFHNGRDIVVDPVFPHMDKSEMVKWYLDNGYDPRYLLNAFSCYSKSSPCGQCSACWRKFIALMDNGVGCEHIFLNDIRAWGEVHYRPRLSDYIPERVESMRRVMGW
jgi:7-cyano-7-deazaguanine synthase in queuosine biosynthesis